MPAQKTSTPQNSKEFPLLIANEGPLKGQRWPIADSIVIGRDATCEVIIADRQVSRYHARLTPTPQGVVVEDLGSKNGTHHNGSALNGPTVLQDGDVIAVSIAQEFMFLTSDSTMPLSEGAGRPGRLRMDPRSRHVWVKQQQVKPPLSVQQFRLLWKLYENPGQVIDRSELMTVVWGEEQSVGVSAQALDALIGRLRERLSALDHKHQYIDTVRGHGVRLDNPPA